MAIKTKSGVVEKTLQKIKGNGILLDFSEFPMRVLVINGSARKEKGCTAMVLAPFINGMKQAGAQVDLLYAKQLNVNPCTGEFDCWYKHPGKCYINDSIQQVYSKLREADILVLGIPVYLPLPGEMQNFLNRLMPLMKPILRYSNGHTQIQFHDDVKIKKIALVSACGWWEKGNFGTVIRIVKEISQKSSVEFVGSVLRPHADLLSERKDKADEIFEAIREGGIRLVEEGSIPKDLLRIIAQPLISEREFRERENQSFLS
jgi:multimeric flavodoxin WrbA